ncbi:amidohydrolase family protein [Gammaproteobacteria bacterium]|nr:amidohydrolase family protein [Gammaproteobacteria bacterium]MDB4059873.1 amidohydrolase family protein [Gammaproteobacteria bacterium]MDB9861734.1 amidohydrolase family protein [Gammaproteobacteria bacterium]
MKNFKTFLAFTLLLPLSGYAEDLLIKNGSIHIGDGTPAFVGDIYIKDGLIEAIGNLDIESSQTVDASGKIITPGFIAATTALGIIEIGALDVTRDDESDYLNMGFSIFRGFNPNSTLIPWNRSNGLTSAITLPQQTSLPLAGMGSFFILDGAIEISGTKDMVMLGRIGASSGSRSEDFDILEGLFKLGKLAKSKSYEKVLEQPLAEFLELHPQDVAALDMLVNKKIPLIMETNRATDILHLIDLKNKYKINMVLAGIEDAPLVLKSLVESNIPVIINPMDNIPDSFDELSSSLKLASVLNKAGVKIVFDSDRSHNYHLIRQGAGNAVAYGMDYNDAISGLSKNVADVFGLKGRGSIQQGFAADILVWEFDPLEPSSIPIHIYINGKEVDLTTRSSRLKDRYINKLSQ